MKKKPTTQTKQTRTKKQQEEANKKEAHEALEYLRNVDVPESQGGGKKYVIDKIEEERKQEQTQKDTIATDLQGAVNITYKTKLAEYGLGKLADVGFPPKWEFYCVPTQKGSLDIFGKRFKTQDGMIIVLRSPKKDVYIRAVGLTYDPIIDMKNINTLAIQAENTLDSIKGLLLSDNKDTMATFPKTQGGVYLPN